MKFDVAIVGAGAAGMMCAIEAAQRGHSVVLIDHASKLAEKIRISGGGRCNFTNMHTKPENYLSGNPHFCRSALARYTPRHFMDWLDSHGIGYHEKKLGQMFCDEGAQAIITMLKNECDAAGVQWLMPCEVVEISSLPPSRGKDGMGVEHLSDGISTPSLALPLAGGGNIFSNARYTLDTTRGAVQAHSMVIATGGLSIPKIGATPFGYRIAQQFSIAVSKLKPGLVPLSFHPEAWAPYAELAGVAVDALVSCGKRGFRENLLFTHRGLSGPAILQISSYWEPGEPLHINLLPEQDMRALFSEHHGSRMLLDNFLAQYLPKRLAEVWCAHTLAENKPLNQYANKELATLAAKLHDWQIIPSGTLGYAKAEVTCGGVDTHALSSKTMQVEAVPGLYFIGEVVDVTGQLGGYNFQWAWASGHAAGQAV